MFISIFWGVHTLIDLMEEFCFTCQFGIRPPLTKWNYKKWSALVNDHLRSEHKEVFPYLCSNELISETEIKTPLYRLWDIIILNLSFDTKHVINKLKYPHDMWMALWKKYGDPIVPPFPDDILSFVASIMVSPTP